MPAPHPPEFRRRAVELAGEKTVPVAQITEDLGISESCLRSWMARGLGLLPSGPGIYFARQRSVGGL